MTKRHANRKPEAAEKSAPQSGRLFEADPRSVADLRDDKFFRESVTEEIREHIAQYKLSGNGIFVWRAWRVARLLGEMTPAMMRVFLPYLDECAYGLLHAEGPTAVAQVLRCSNPLHASGEGNKSAAKQESDYWLLAEFVSLTTRQHSPLSKEEAYRRLGAARGKPDGGAMKRKIRALQGKK